MPADEVPADAGFWAKRWNSTKSLGRFLRQWGDAMLAASAAIVVGFFAAIGSLKGDALTGATVGLLGVISFVLIRERWMRTEGFAELNDQLTRVEEDAVEAKGAADKAKASADETRDAMTSTSAAVVEATRGAQDLIRVLAGEAPYEVLSGVYSWELLDTEGREAVGRNIKDLRFVADRVFCIREQYTPTGHIADHRCWGTVEGRARTELPIMHDEFPGPEGRKYRMISLEGFLNRGQRMQFESERKILDSFMDRRESVSVDIEIPTDRLAIEVIWPVGSGVESVDLERPDRRPAENVFDRVEQLQDGRRRLFVRIEDPSKGEKIYVVWRWPGGRADTR
ncbi:MAG: hypothetical protein JOZ69_22645 [Myxococcales bacterium]|nr:hypothetical protein [Myxococcales bacterium]